jgi:hypothetical protein
MGSQVGNSQVSKRGTKRGSKGLKSLGRGTEAELKPDPPNVHDH